MLSARSCICAGALLPLVCFAGARRFGFVYEAPTTPPGVIEVENWMTWQTHPPNDADFAQIDFRHELEFGLTEHLQLGIYLADWNYHSRSAARSRGLSYGDTAVEIIYNFTNPAVDWIGLSAYEELQMGDRHGELESKLIAQKDIGRFVAAYNVALEAEWEGSRWREQNGELQQVLGLSYEFSPRFFLGAELLHEIGLPNWTEHGRAQLFAGPDISLRTGWWWITVTTLAQLTRHPDEPELQIRAITGYTF
jgi:hypothetical protein